MAWWHRGKAKPWHWAQPGRADRRLSILRFSARERAGRKTWGYRLAPATISLFGLAAGAVLIWAGVQSLGWLLFRQNELFRLRDIKIECKGDIITPKHIMDYAGLADVHYLFAVNITAMREQLLLKVPRLKSVEITRRLPGQLIINVRERLALANLAVNNYYLSLDRDGYVLGPASGSKTMPVLTGYALPGIRPGVQLSGAGIRNALEVLDVCQTTPVGLRIRIASIDLRNAQALELHLEQGERVRLAWDHMGESSALSREHLEQKLSRLADSLKKAAARNKRIAWIDMRLDNNFPAQEY
ncbi:MAG: FtsQ-type POTRA domain-containing protein [Lentisphaerae bacterium]|nr:FtsQ-type POTRA domain-containing protein [Lentisphaerota bacterium]